MQMFGSHEQYTYYYASTTEHLATSPIKSYMLPLFNESPKSPAMVWHGIKVLHQYINVYYTNLRQTPVTDKAWREYSYQVTVWKMHSEKMLWGVSGDWLDGNDWNTELTNMSRLVAKLNLSSVSTTSAEPGTCSSYQLPLCTCF